MQKQVTQNSHTATTQYMGGYQYSNTRLQFFPTAEGYVKNTIIQGQNSYDYVYNLTDHLGNIRMSFGLDPKTQQLVKFEENNYYPFGLKHSRYNDQLREITEKQSYSIQLEDIITEKRSAQKTLAIPSNPDAEDIVLENSGYQYKFQNKEWQDELGFNTYDFGARGYMPDIVRTPTLDPLAEKFYSFSPYSFLNNNPLRFVDPDGKQSIDFDKVNRNENSNSGFSDGPQYIASTVVDNRGKIIDHKDDGDDNIYLNKRGGIVVGKERKGVEYTPGKTVRRADLLEDFNYTNGVITDVSRINAEKKAGKNPNAQIHNCPVCSARRCNGASHTNIRRATNSGVAGVTTRGAILTTTASTYVYGWSGFLSGLFLGFSTGYGDDVFNQYDEYNAELEKEKDKK